METCSYFFSSLYVATRVVVIVFFLTISFGVKCRKVARFCSPADGRNNLSRERENGKNERSCFLPRLRKRETISFSPTCSHSAPQSTSSPWTSSSASQIFVVVLENVVVVVFVDCARARAFGVLLRARVCVTVVPLSAFERQCMRKREWKREERKRLFLSRSEKDFCPNVAVFSYRW